LSNVVEHIVLCCNKHLCVVNPDGPPVLPDMVSAIETQVLLIQNSDNKIRILVGNIFVIQYK